MRLDPANLTAETAGGIATLLLSDAGGLTQFGCYLQTAAPGASTGEGHWHSAEDEFLLVVDGVATLVDDAGETELRPGDAACFRHGQPDAHAFANRGDTPCRWLILGSRVLCDICTYPATGRRLVNGETDWRIETAAGERVKGGRLPDKLMDLRPDWGRPFDGTVLPRVIRRGDLPGESAPSSAPAPFDQLGDYRAFPLSDAGGLTQFGAFTEVLMPGSRSSHRHWHETEDEFLYVLDGIVTLHEDGGVQDLVPGDCAAWPAGLANGHCLENRTGAPVTYFVAGTRLPDDTVTYPDIDLHYVRKGGMRWLLHKDGTPYPGWPKESNR